MSSHADFAVVAPGAEGVRRDHQAAAHLPILDADAGRIDWFGSGRKKIALCGFAGSSRHRMPIADPSWIIVGLNQLYRHIARADVWFDIHLDWRAGNVEGTDHPRWLAECGLPVFMVEREPSIPTAVRNPKAALDLHFGINYATSTVAHMLRLFTYEIDRDVERRLGVMGNLTAQPLGMTVLDAYKLGRSLYAEYTIGIFGIDLIVGTEYAHQRQCAEFWIGEAEARGIVIDVPPESALLKQMFCYGYEQEPAAWPLRQRELETRRDSLSARREQIAAQVREAQLSAARLEGAILEEEMLIHVAQLRARGATVGLPKAEEG